MKWNNNEATNKNVFIDLVLKNNSSSEFHMECGKLDNFDV